MVLTLCGTDFNSSLVGPDKGVVCGDIGTNLFQCLDNSVLVGGWAVGGEVLELLIILAVSFKDFFILFRISISPLMWASLSVAVQQTSSLCLKCTTITQILMKVRHYKCNTHNLCIPTFQKIKIASRSIESGMP